MMNKRIFQYLGIAILIGGGAYFIQIEAEIPEYDRKEWSHWTTKDCINTREAVLIRDAKQIELSEDGCEVLDGVWYDPYSGVTILDPSKIDIDHYVPLKNAHESGAWEWDKEKKKEYANYLGNDYHLIAVSATENRRKGAKGPDEYLPPNEDYQCEYIKNWIEVKRDWDLEITFDVNLKYEIDANEGLKSCTFEIIN